jgi:serine/threonine-protein kinase SRPK3
MWFILVSVFFRSTTPSLYFTHRARIDISPNNMLCGVKGLSPFKELEEAERAQPVAPKVLRDRVIYLSRQTPMTQGEPVLSDLGSARFGQEQYQGNIIPLVYRAPEMISDMKWSSKVDIWSMGVMVSSTSSLDSHLTVSEPHFPHERQEISCYLSFPFSH